MVLARPADVTAGIVRPVVKLPKTGNASVLHAHLVIGRTKARYRNHLVHIFTARRREGEYEVFTEKEIDLGEYSDAHEVVECVRWSTALFTDPGIVLGQDLDADLHMAGDHNGLGVEPGAVERTPGARGHVLDLRAAD